MTNDEIQEIISKGKSDGATLFRVAALIHKVSTVFIWIFGLLGIGLVVAAMSNAGLLGGLAALFGVLLVVGILYAVSVMASHTMLVLVHILFSNLALLERGGK